MSSWRRFFCFHALPLCSPQGIKHSDHFGFICRDQLESGPSQYGCFVFQCASESLVSHTRPVNENNSILLFWAPRTSLCMHVLSYWCTSGGWGDADLEAGLLYSSSSAEQQNRDPAVWSLPHAWPAQTLWADRRWFLPPGTCLWHYSWTYWCMGCFRRTDKQNEKMRGLYCPPLSPGLYPPRAKLAIQKYLSQLTDNEQAEMFERVQVLFSELREKAGTLFILPSVSYFWCLCCVQRLKPRSDQEENELVIFHLRQLCDNKQASHIHIGEVCPIHTSP